MKKLDTYINEKLVISKDIDTQYKYFPKTKEELREIIDERIDNEGNECNLNDIDVSAITDMSALFYDHYKIDRYENFNGDISKWDVSNVTNMKEMFALCDNFNCDISKWDVGNVEDMSYMFVRCKNFSQDLSQWDISNVTNMEAMFYRCANFEGNKLETWNMSQAVKNGMFYKCKSVPSWWKK